MLTALALFQAALLSWNLDVALVRMAFVLLGLAAVALGVTVGLTWSRGLRD